MMPTLFKLCNEHGCRNKAKPEESYCEIHLKQRRREYDSKQRDSMSTRFYNSTLWGRIRKIQLSRQPLCEACLSEGRTTPATVVDHIEAIKESGPQLDLENLQSLCASCHSKKHSEDGSRWGKQKGGA